MEIKLYLRMLQRGWWLIVLTMLAAVNFSLLISYLTPPTYRAVSRFVVSPNAGVYDNSWDVVSSLDTLDRRSIINTYKELLMSPSVYGKSPEIQSLDSEKLATTFNVSAVVVPDTNILQLTVDGRDPDQVLLLAEAIGSQALIYINQLYPVYNFSVLDAPELPTVPIQPEPVQNAGLALLIGGIIGVGLAFSREQLQSSFEQLKQRSIIDNATTAFTRTYFERKLREEITRNPDSSLSIGIINLRGLDEYDGVLPQVITDRVLNKVTHTLKNELRGRDIVGRWDKTQLSVLLPSTPMSAVESTFKRLQSFISEPIYINESKDLVVRPDPCIGVVSRNQLETDEVLIQRAESAVEQASAFESAAVIVLSTPFIFDTENE